MEIGHPPKRCSTHKPSRVPWCWVVLSQRKKLTNSRSTAGNGAVTLCQTSDRKHIRIFGYSVVVHKTMNNRMKEHTCYLLPYFLHMWEIRQLMDISLQGFNHPISCRASSINSNGPSHGTCFRLTLLYSMNTSWWSRKHAQSKSWTKLFLPELTREKHSTFSPLPSSLSVVPMCHRRIPMATSMAIATKQKQQPTNWRSPYNQIAANHWTITTNDIHRQANTWFPWSTIRSSFLVCISPKLMNHSPLVTKANHLEFTRERVELAYSTVTTMEMVASKSGAISFMISRLMAIS